MLIQFLLNRSQSAEKEDLVTFFWNTLQRMRILPFPFIDSLHLFAGIIVGFVVIVVAFFI